MQIGICKVDLRFTWKYFDGTIKYINEKHKK